jgi:hypothetical protein
MLVVEELSLNKKFWKEQNPTFLMLFYKDLNSLQRWHFTELQNSTQSASVFVPT